MTDNVPPIAASRRRKAIARYEASQPRPSERTVLRDLLHETPASACSMSSDECDTWFLADALMDIWRTEGVLPMLEVLTEWCREGQRRQVAAKRKRRWARR